MKHSVDRLILAFAVSFGLLAAACGGGGGTITPTPAPTPTSGPFSASSLNGTYAFEMTGSDSAGFLHAHWQLRGERFGYDNGGRLNDLNSGLVPGVVTLAISSESYTMRSNGKGTLTLIDSGGETLQFSIVMTSATDGLLTETDGNATGSGNFTVQDTTTFASFPNNISGPYVFDFTGVDPS